MSRTQLVGKDTLSAKDFYTHDPFMYLLREKLHLSKAKIIIGAMIITAAVFFGGTALAGGPFTPGYTGFIDAVDSLRKVLGLIPLAFAIYLLLPDSIAGLFNALQKNNVIGESQPGHISHKELLDKFIAVASSRVLVIGAFLIVLMYWVQRIVSLSQNHKRPLALEVIVMLFVYSPALYGSLIGIGQLLVVLVFTRTLFTSYDIRVNPLHPDGCAGFGTVGRMLTISLLIASVLGVVVAIGLFLPHPEGANAFSRIEPWFLFLIYLMIIPLLFRVLLWLPHEKMTKARDARLEPIAEEFRKALPVDGADTATIKRNVNQMSELKKEYESIIEVFPVWPIRIKLLHKLAGTATISLISTLISVAINLGVKSTK